MTFNIRLAEVSEAKELVTFYNLYLDEYEQSNSKTTRLPFKQLLNDIRSTINQKRLYVVTYQNTICAFTDLMCMGNDEVSYNFIKNLFVKEDYRHQGIAKLLRDTLIQRNRITGTTVSYKRLRDNIDYFKESFNYVYHDIAHEQSANDNNLVYVSTKDIWGNAQGISRLSIDMMQKACQRVLQKRIQQLQSLGFIVNQQ